MRAAFLAVLLAAPALATIVLATPVLAQDGYDAKVLTGCLDSAGSNDPSQCIGKASDACMDAPDGETTAGMAQCIGAETKQWDTLLNRYYSQAIARDKAADADLQGGDVQPAAPMLQKAQRAWIAFRDASCSYEAARYQGGSMASVAAGQCILQLTADQALRLRDLAETEG